MVFKNVPRGTVDIQKILTFDLVCNPGFINSKLEIKMAFKKNDIIICIDVRGSFFKYHRSKDVIGVKIGKTYTVIDGDENVVHIINDFDIKKTYKNSRFRYLNPLETRYLKIKDVMCKMN